MGRMKKPFHFTGPILNGTAQMVPQGNPCPQCGRGESVILCSCGWAAPGFIYLRKEER